MKELLWSKLKRATNFVLFLLMRGGVEFASPQSELGSISYLTIECSRSHVAGLIKLGHKKSYSFHPGLLENFQCHLPCTDYSMSSMLWGSPYQKTREGSGGERPHQSPTGPVIPSQVPIISEEVFRWPQCQPPSLMITTWKTLSKNQPAKPVNSRILRENTILLF